MEIAFIIRAVKRFWWLVVAFVAVGLLGGFLVNPSVDPQYSSVALINVSAPSGAQFGESDRYISSQIVVLESSVIAREVAASADPELNLTPFEVSQAVTFTQLVGTDVVRIEATSSSPVRAEAIATGYLNGYFEDLRKQLADSSQPERDAIDDAIDDLETELQAVDQEVERVLAPFLNRDGADVPSIEQVDSQLATARAALIDQYNSLLRARNDAALTETRVTSQIIQRPEIPDEADPSGLPLALVAGPLFGVILGVTAATIAARTSPKVLGVDEAEDLLGTAFVGELPRSAELAAPLEEIISNGAAHDLDAIDQVCVRAESHSPAGVPFVVLVTGTQRAAGTTSVATAVASHFAANGNEVTLIDADPGHPSITRSLAGGTRGLIGLIGRNTDESTTRSKRRRPTRTFSSTSLDSLRVVGFGDGSGPAQQLGQISDLVDAARLDARVVVFDGGPLMASASTVQLSRIADAVILTVPVAQQDSDGLRVVSRQLRAAQGIVLPVSLPRLRPRKDNGHSDAEEEDRNLEAV